MTDLERHAHNIAYCRKQVQKYAEDLAIAAQFCPRERYDRVIAIYAFSCEINRIPESVSEPPLGAIRQQWWRDALAEIMNGELVRAHPVVEALRPVLEDMSVSQHFVKKMQDAIEATDFLLEPADFQTPEAVFQFACKTYGYVSGLSARVLDPALLPAEEERLITLEAVSAIVRVMTAVQLQDGKSTGTIETFANRLSRYLSRTKNCAALADMLSETLTNFRHKYQPIQSRIMPSIAQAALLPGYVKNFTQLQDRPGMFRGVSKRARIFGAILTGRI